MKIKSVDLAWIVVDNLEAAKQFYVDTLGFRVTAFAPEHGWAELMAPEGSFVIGLAQKNDFDAMKPGSNAIITITVENLDTAISDLKEQNATLIGDVLEIPGHVKMISLADRDGNRLQLVEKLG